MNQIPMDPMSQYDPATAAMIAGQGMPQAHPVQPQADPFSGMNKVIQQMMMMKRGQQGQPGRPSQPGQDNFMGQPTGPYDQAQSLSYLKPQGFGG